MDNSGQCISGQYIDISNTNISKSNISTEIPLIKHGGFFRYTIQKNYEMNSYMKRHTEKNADFSKYKDTDDKP